MKSMIGKINSVKVKKVNDAMNHATITEKELDLMAQFTDKDLAEFFYCINDGLISVNVLAYYFVVFDSKLINKLEKELEFDFIDKLLATAWVENISNIPPKDVLEMLLGLSIINSNLIKRIRNGLVLDIKKLKAFDIQIENIIKELLLDAEKNRFVSVLTGIEITDHEAADTNELGYILVLKDDVLSLHNVFELYDITHGNFNNKEYLAKDKKKITEHENSLRNSIKNSFENVSNIKNKISYLPNHFQELIIGLTTNAPAQPVKSRSLRCLDSLDSISTVEPELEDFGPVSTNKEDRVLSFFGKKMDESNDSKKFDEKISMEPLNCSDMIVGESYEEQTSTGVKVLKLAVVILLILAIVGWVLSLRSNNENGLEHVKNLTHNEILMYKTSTGEGKYDIKIQRSGTKDNANATVQSISSEIN